MSNDATQEEVNREFKRYLQVRLFGLLAFVARPNDDEHFPMCSGVVIEAKGAYVLLTVAHYLADLKRWKEQGRLTALFLMVHHDSGLCNPIPLNLDENLAFICDRLDIGFVGLNDDVLAEIAKHGGKVTRRDTLSVSPENMKSFYLVGLAAAYSQVVCETIATAQDGPVDVAWKLARPGDLAAVISKIRFDGTGSGPGTFRFALIQGFDDYSGASGGPIFGYTAGALIRDYSYFAIQSKQVRGAIGDQPTHLIATSAALAIKVIDEYL
jgi:hypothetical protein